jgi:hypothetical protein
MVHTAALGSLRVLSRGSRGFLDSAIGAASILAFSPLKMTRVEIPRPENGLIILLPRHACPVFNFDS